MIQPVYIMTDTVTETMSFGPEASFEALVLARNEYYDDETDVLSDLPSDWTPSGDNAWENKEHDLRINKYLMRI